jgi:hypothetical protein
MRNQNCFSCDPKPDSFTKRSPHRNIPLCDDLVLRVMNPAAFNSHAVTELSLSSAGCSFQTWVTCKHHCNRNTCRMSR